MTDTFYALLAISMVLVNSCSTVDHSAVAPLQIEGATTFGLGQVLFEEVLQDTNGSITNPNLSDYMIPSFEDVPAELTVHMLEPHGVTDVHGVGETAIPPARPAIGNAISRGVGCHFLDLPITPEKVLRALNQQKLTSKR